MACVEVADLVGKTIECDLAEIMSRANLRDDRGDNYMIVSPASGQRFPVMVISFKGNHAVVSYVQDEESGMQLLTGDSSTEEDEMQFCSPAGGYDTYTSEFIVASSTAVRFLEAFVTGVPWPELPFWETL